MNSVNWVIQLFEYEQLYADLVYSTTRVSDTSDTSAKRVQQEYDTSATRVLHEQQKCDSSEKFWFW